MTETIVILKLLHKKPLPRLMTDIVAQRTYSWLYSQGVEAGVTATLVEVPDDLQPLPVRQMTETSDGQPS